MVEDELSDGGASHCKPWLVAGRPGYVGGSLKKRVKRLDKLFGEERWRIDYLWRGETISREAALTLYEEAYARHLESNPDVLDWLCRTASDVYDTQPSNVESGMDYAAQEGGPTHLQDIAVRRCVARLGRRFEGDHLVQIRGRNSEGYALNPGIVPFHEPESIIQPRVSPGPWVEPASVEDFWQSNKILCVHPECSEVELKQHVLRELEPPKREEVRVALFGGSFNPIHHGHLRVAQDLVDRWGFAKVLFVPNGNGYRKSGLVDEGHRARMIELAIAGEPRFELCRFELGRDKAVYSHHTIDHMQSELADEANAVRLYNIRGSDTIHRMLRWKSLARMLQVPQIVPIRPGATPWQDFGSHATFMLYCDHFRLVPAPCADGLSSSLIRQSLRAGHSVRYWVPESVRAYIEEHRLYRG